MYVGPAGQAARVPNDAAGFTALIAWVEVPVRAVTDEPTGRWHRAFEEALLEAGLPLVRVNPLHARRFAQAIGQRAKTDAVNARVLAQMGAALVKDRTAALTRQTQGRHRLLKQSHKNRLAQLDRHLAAIDTAIGKRLAEDEGLARRPEILTSIPDVFRVTAAGLLTQMPALGRLDAKEVASLAGLTPVTRQSGAWQGRSFIQGGRARARRLLYMPALAATRTAAGSPTGPGGPARRSSRPDRRLSRGGRAWRREGLCDGLRDTWILRSGPPALRVPRMALAAQQARRAGVHHRPAASYGRAGRARARPGPPVVRAAAPGDGAGSVACARRPITRFMGPSPRPAPPPLWILTSRRPSTNLEHSMRARPRPTSHAPPGV